MHAVLENGRAPVSCFRIFRAALIRALIGGTLPADLGARVVLTVGELYV